MNDQVLLSATLIALLGLFIWGKVRYDALAIGALFVLVVLEIIPANDAFAGFAHPAVVTVALVLIISQGLKNSGLTGLVGKLIGTRTFTEFQFLVCLLFIAAILSSFINNIGALAILLPITLNICQKMEWHASKFLMPLAFACILGGMNTAIGTPPNIIISEYKATISSSGFNFFDFSYVGIVITLLSILFIALLGNKFILLRNTGSKTEHLINLKGYLFEVCVNDGSSAIGMTLYKFKKQAGEDTEILGIVSENGSVKKVQNNMRIKSGQILVIKTPPDEIGNILDVFSFSIPKELHSFDEDDLEEIEVMITPGSRLIGRKYDFFLKLAFEELNLRYLVPFLHKPNKFNSSKASFRKKSYFLPINLEPGLINTSISSRSASSKECNSSGIEKSKRFNIFPISSGGLLITKICPSLIRILF